jgi:hypothetical protein
LALALLNPALALLNPELAALAFVDPNAALAF